MQHDHASATRIATHHPLAHERADRELCRSMKMFQLVCLGFALLGTVSTAAAWQGLPVRAATLTYSDVSGGEVPARPAHVDLDLGAFVQIAGR